MSPLQSSACLEKGLLALCARTEISPGIAAKICELASQPLDWEYAVAEANDHSIIALLHAGLKKAATPVPDDWAAKIEQAVRANAVRCLAYSAELVRVMELFESRGIEALPYKGPVIAAQAYGDISARQFEDLDIVLRQRDIRVADNAIRSLGYDARFALMPGGSAGRETIPGEYNYSHRDRRVMVELHTERTLRHFPVRPNLDQLFERAVKVNVGGREVPTFRPEDALLMLCVHGAKDFWQRLLWIADVAELLRSHPTLNWGLVQCTAEALRAERMLHLGLGLAAQLLGAERSPEMSAALKADPRALHLAAEIEKRLTGRETPDRSAAERFRFRRDMVAGVSQGWLYSMRLTLAPAEEDWRNRRVPQHRSPFYAALRPIRLLRKYGWMHKA